MTNTQSAYSIKRESAIAIWDELQPLISRHFAETASHQDIPVEMNKEFYFATDKTGMVQWYVVRAASGEMAGYAAYIVAGNPHRCPSKQALEDLFYIVPEHRRQGLAARLIEHACGELRRQGVQVVAHCVSTRLDWRPLLERLGFVMTEYHLTRRLDR